MLYMAIGQLIHQERQREIERKLEIRRLLEPADETGWDLRQESRKDSGESRLGSRQETAGAAS